LECLGHLRLQRLHDGREYLAEIGRIVGRAGDREGAKKVVRAALEMFTCDVPPGKVVLKEI
jgi:hypothetical protein